MNDVRGLDAYLSRGHEIQDSDPDPVHPDEQSLLETADAGIERELDQAQSAEALREAVAFTLRRIQRREDEAVGQWLQGGGR